MFFKKIVDKQSVVHSHKGILLSNKKNELLIYSTAQMNIQRAMPRKANLNVTYYMIPLYNFLEMIKMASQVALVVKNLPANAGVIRGGILSLGWQDPMEEAMATHSSILAWRIPWTEDPGGLLSIESQRVRQDRSDGMHMQGGNESGRVVSVFTKG